MALRRAALASRSLKLGEDGLAEGSSSGWLQEGQRLAKPGLSGFSSNSSWQMAQTRIGNDILLSMIKPVVWLSNGRADSE